MNVRNRLKVSCNLAEIKIENGFVFFAETKYCDEVSRHQR